MAVAVARKKTRLEEGKGQDVQRDIEDEDRSLKEDAMLAEDDQDPAPDSEKKEKTLSAKGVLTRPWRVRRYLQEVYAMKCQAHPQKGGVPALKVGARQEPCQAKRRQGRRTKTSRCKTSTRPSQDQDHHQVHGTRK